MQYEKERKLEELLGKYVDDFIRQNRAAQVMNRLLDDAGIGFRPILDHLTFRTLHVDERAKEFLALGYVEGERLEYNNWWAKVYRKPGYPAMFIDQAFDGERGKDAVIPPWVKKHGDLTLHHVAVSVHDIEHCIAQLKKHGIECKGQIVGERGGPLRQIFTAPESRDGEPFSVLELAERHFGFAGFAPPQADGLMQSTVADVKKAA
jgi:catechol 2,3-dioxygenase-like lactoylglutathione lyase family enzyme